MNFIEEIMISQLLAQDMIIVAKTEQSYVNKEWKEDPSIVIGDMIVVSNESELSHLSKSRQKLTTKWIDSCRVTKKDRSKLNSTPDIKDSKWHSTFHVSNSESASWIVPKQTTSTASNCTGETRSEYRDWEDYRPWMTSERCNSWPM